MMMMMMVGVGGRNIMTSVLERILRLQPNMLLPLCLHHWFSSLLASFDCNWWTVSRSSHHHHLFGASNVCVGGMARWLAKK
jgi:hypothetical protein